MGLPRLSTPSISRRPVVGRSSPLKCLTRVVLPEPFCPTTPRTSPARIFKLVSFKACTPPGYTCVIRSTTIGCSLTVAPGEGRLAEGPNGLLEGDRVFGRRAMALPGQLVSQLGHLGRASMVAGQGLHLRQHFTRRAGKDDLALAHDHQAVGVSRHHFHLVL